MDGAPGNNVISRSGRPEVVAKRPPTWKLPISRTWMGGSPFLEGCALTAVVPHTEEAQQRMRSQQAAVTGAPSPRVLLAEILDRKASKPREREPGTPIRAFPDRGPVPRTITRRGIGLSYPLAGRAGSGPWWPSGTQAMLGQHPRQTLPMISCAPGVACQAREGARGAGARRRWREAGSRRRTRADLCRPDPGTMR
jgi:hypothetical protein